MSLLVDHHLALKNPSKNQIKKHSIFEGKTKIQFKMGSDRSTIISIMYLSNIVYEQSLAFILVSQLSAETSLRRRM